MKDNKIIAIIEGSGQVKQTLVDDEAMKKLVDSTILSVAPSRQCLFSKRR